MMSESESLSEPRWGSEDRPRKAQAIWQTMLYFCGPEIAKGVWLDVGCGSGGIAAALAPKVRNMVGFDPEPWPKWSTLMSDHPNLTFLRGSYENAPLEIAPRTFDAVICNQVYEHVPDPVALIGFIHTILKPGGYCYFAGPNLLWPIEPHVLWPFVHWLPRRLAIRAMKASGSRAVLDAYSADYWRLRRRFSQFQVQNAVPHILRHPIDYSRTGVVWQVFSWIPALLLHLLTPFSPGFVFVLRKALN